MRISDWSSDVCSSDLDPGEAMPPLVRRPDLPTDTAIDRSAWSDDFDAPALSPEWIWLRGSNRHGWSALNSRSGRSEEHTSELQSLMRISYAVFCLKKKKNNVINSSNIRYVLTYNIG